MAPTRWGIAGGGRISHDFVNALSLLPKDDHQVVAIGTRRLDKAEKFSEEFNIPKVYGSYKELAQDPDLDVVYVGTITATHFDVCKVLIEAGKNVLCEKAITVTTAQAKTLLQLAREKNVFFMEGFWSRFFPAYNKLTEALTAGTIGDVKAVSVNFGLDITAFIDGTEAWDGATLALGCYAVQFAQLVFNEYPERVIASGMLTANGADECCAATLHYSNNRIAQLFYHVGVRLPNVAYVHGTKGSIEIPNFWCPLTVTVAGEQHEFPLGVTAAKPMNYPGSEGFIHEAEGVRQALLKGEKESPLMTHDHSLQNMSIMTEILEQMGISYNV